MMTPADVRAVVRTTLDEQAGREMQWRKGVFSDVLILLGIDPNAPDDKISEEIDKVRKSIAHSYWWLQRVEQGSKVGLATVIAVATTAILGALWLGFKGKLGL